MLRKGQKLFNGIIKKHDLQAHICGPEKNLIPYVNLHQIIYYMSDEEFDEIMNND